jgi:hypothetical protein
VLGKHNRVVGEATPIFLQAILKFKTKFYGNICNLRNLGLVLNVIYCEFIYLNIFNGPKVGDNFPVDPIALAEDTCDPVLFQFAFRQFQHLEFCPKWFS